MSSIENDDFEFITVETCASLTVPCLANDLRQAGHAILEGRPCKIINIARSKPGKHGHAKVVVTGLDIFTGGKSTMEAARLRTT